MPLPLLVARPDTDAPEADIERCRARGRMCSVSTRRLGGVWSDCKRGADCGGCTASSPAAGAGIRGKGRMGKTGPGATFEVGRPTGEPTGVGAAGIVGNGAGRLRW